MKSEKSRKKEALEKRSEESKEIPDCSQFFNTLKNLDAKKVVVEEDMETLSEHYKQGMDVIMSKYLRDIMLIGLSFLLYGMGLKSII